jgi:hypothetical protein
MRVLSLPGALFRDALHGRFVRRRVSWIRQHLPRRAAVPLFRVRSGYV